MPRLFKFGTVGASGAIVGLTILWLLTDLAGLYYIVSYAIAFMLSVGNNYLWNSLWTFKGREANALGLSKYLAISTGTLGLNLVLVYLLTSILGLWYMLSAVIVTIVVFLINYLLSQRYVWIKSTSR